MGEAREGSRLLVRWQGLLLLLQGGGRAWLWWKQDALNAEVPLWWKSSEAVGEEPARLRYGQQWLGPRCKRHGALGIWQHCGESRQLRVLMRAAKGSQRNVRQMRQEPRWRQALGFLFRLSFGCAFERSQTTQREVEDLRSADSTCEWTLCKM